MSQPVLISDEVRQYVQVLRLWRERRGMTQRALAEAMKYDPSRVSHIEARRQAPTEEFTRQAEEVLQTDGALWSCWESIAVLKLGLPARPPERDLRTVEFLAWLADHSSMSFQSLYTAVNALVARRQSQPPSVRYAREHQRRAVARAQLADSLIAYYGNGPGGSFYAARVADAPVRLSILTQPTWLDVGVALGTHAEACTFVPPDPAERPSLSESAVNTALERLASVEMNGTVMVNNPLYRLLEVDLEPNRLAASMTTADFAYHALTTELMERELLDAVASGDDPRSLGNLPLRDAFLPDARTAFSLRDRVCVGGPVALLAIARSSFQGAHDYVLFVQERSSTVLNATGKLGLVPKAFHQPTSEPAYETRLSQTLQREFEEELLGRQDLEQIAGSGGRHVDLLHDQHLTEPMAWLLDNPGTYRVECTGLGFNMVTSNYEFASLIVIDDEQWWNRFGGMVEINWEAARVHRYSTLDTAGLATLVDDPRWGNESLFALLQGMRRLTEVGDPSRVALPAVDLDVG